MPDVMPAGPADNPTADLLPPPDTVTVGVLWTTLVRVLSVVLVLSVLGIGWAVLDGNDKTASDVLVTIFTATLTGLIGLFVKPEQ